MTQNVNTEASLAVLADELIDGAMAGRAQLETRLEAVVIFDTNSGASREHYARHGRFLTVAESVTRAWEVIDAGGDLSWTEALNDATAGTDELKTLLDYVIDVPDDHLPRIELDGRSGADGGTGGAVVYAADGEKVLDTVQWPHVYAIELDEK